MLISNLTESVFCPTLGHLRVSDFPSRRRRHLLRLLLGCRRGKIARYRGQRLAPAGEFERRPGESSSGCSVAETSSGWTVGALDETLKSEDEPLLCVAPNVGVLGLGTGTTRWSAGQFLLLLLLIVIVRAPVHARLARAVFVLVLATHPKRELRRLANNPPSRTARVAGACRPLLAMLSRGWRRCPVQILER